MDVSLIFFQISLIGHIVHSSVNYMEEQAFNNLSEARELARSVGEFIRYWGFRNIHGEIWAMVYLAETPPSGKELTELLDVSKALVSPALQELLDEGLIAQAESENSKTKRYEAVEDVITVIRSVLNRRERPMMDRIIESHGKLKKRAPHGFNSRRLKKMGSMINTAHLGLAFLSEPSESWL